MTGESVFGFLWKLLLFVAVKAQESAVTCSSSVDKNWVILTCVNRNQFLEFNGNCNNGVKKETYSLRDCLFDQDLNPTFCHECDSNRVTCSSSADPTVACADFSNASIPSNIVDCDERESVLLTQAYQCTSATAWAYEDVECIQDTELSIVVLSESCSSTQNNTPTCLECGPVGYCVPEGTTCNDLDNIQDPFVIESSVTCIDTVDTAFYEDICLDQSTQAFLFGNCTGGVKEEESTLSKCPDTTPFCHECGFNKLVCSDSEDKAAVCSNFSGRIPSDFDCAVVGNAEINGDQCINETTLMTELITCEGGELVNSFYENVTCGDVYPGKTACLDCGRIGHCVEEGTACANLESGDNSTSVSREGGK